MAPNDDSAATARLPNGPVRDGAVTARPIDLYMAQYAGRDSSRPQRLRFWTAQLGDVALRDLSDDNVFHALERLKVTRPRYFAGLDAVAEGYSGPSAMRYVEPR